MRAKSPTDHFPDQAPPLDITSALWVEVAGWLITCLVLITGLIGSLLISVGKTAWEFLNVGTVDP